LFLMMHNQFFAPIVGYAPAESRVTAGDAAVLATNDGPDELARLIDELLDAPARRGKLGPAARVERELAWEQPERARPAGYERALAE
jgi:hypothetical protein